MRGSCVEKVLSGRAPRSGFWWLCSLQIIFSSSFSVSFMRVMCWHFTEQGVSKGFYGNVSSFFCPICFWESGVRFYIYKIVKKQQLDELMKEISASSRGAKHKGNTSCSWSPWAAARWRMGDYSGDVPLRLFLVLYTLQTQPLLGIE